MCVNSTTIFLCWSRRLKHFFLFFLFLFRNALYQASTLNLKLCHSDMAKVSIVKWYQYPQFGYARNSTFSDTVKILRPL